MIMKKMLAFVALLLGVVGFTFAQSSGQVLEFEKDTYDFGIVNEGTVAEHTFIFTNKSANKITLGNVQASCGCTTPSWSREPIAPQGQGKIVASYNSEGRPGAFLKTVSVTFNEENQPPQTIVLTIKGTVLGKMGAADPSQNNSVMLLEKAEHNFGKVQLGQKVAKTFTFKNIGTSDLSIVALYAQCNCITHNVSQQIIKPSESATIEIIFAPTQVNSKDETVMIYTNSNTQPQVTITLKGEVVQSLAGGSLLKEADGF
jgi:hypothetical protein